MRHHLKIVARIFNVNQQELEDFARKNKRKYGIEDENGFITTSTLFTEELIKDFKNEQRDKDSLV